MRVRRTAGVVAVALLAAAGVAGPAAGETVISTLADENNTIAPFGCPETPAYGQVITVPAGATSLDVFTFRMDIPAAVVFRGEVFAWNGTMATGPELFRSAPRSTAGTGMETVTFATGGVPVVVGDEYIVFAAADCTATPNNTDGPWGTVEPGTYADGSFSFQNNLGDESQWTTVPWNQFTDTDLAFEVIFDVPPPPPTPPPPAPEEPTATPIAIELVPTFTG
jgi:hypothetical protein